MEPILFGLWKEHHKEKYYLLEPRSSNWQMLQQDKLMTSHN